MNYQETISEAFEMLQLIADEGREVDGMVTFSGHSIDEILSSYAKAQPAQEPLCRYPLCQSEAEQSMLADEIHRELVSGAPAQGERQPDDARTPFCDANCWGGDHHPYCQLYTKPAE